MNIPVRGTWYLRKLFQRCHTLSNAFDISKVIVLIFNLFSATSQIMLVMTVMGSAIHLGERNPYRLSFIVFPAEVFKNLLVEYKHEQLSDDTNVVKRSILRHGWTLNHIPKTRLDTFHRLEEHIFLMWRLNIFPWRKITPGWCS